MKKFIAAALACALLALGGYGLLKPRPAGANVPCSVPFNLLNGTTADATQVMANYNAILTCLTQAASAGANSDITSILGLTTALSYTLGGSSIYIGGTATNVGNAYTVVSPVPTGFTLTAGKIVSFTPVSGNTGATTLTVASVGTINLFRQTPSGPLAMVGGEIVANQPVLALYDGTQYECISCAPTALVPTGTVLDFSGPITPAGFLLANGQTVSRTTFSVLFNTLAYTSVSATTTNSSTSIQVPNSSLFQIGWYVGGTNVTCNSYINSIPDGSHIVINANASSGGATTLTIGPYQQGDCSTTFHLPNYTGKVLAMVDGSTNITGTFCPNAFSIGDKQVVPNNNCGSQSQLIAAAQLPANIPYTDPGHIHTTTQLLGATVLTTAGGSIGFGSGSGNTNSVTAGFSINSATTGITINPGGGSALRVLTPTSMTYKIIKT